MEVRGGCAHDCPDTCAWQVTVEDGRAVELAGLADHPYTHAGLCAKVNHYLDRVYSPDRVLHPMRRSGAKGEGRFERVSWDDALGEIADRFRAILERDGGEAILPYSYAGNSGLVQGGSLDRRFFARLGASRLDRTICGATANAGVTAALGTATGCMPEDIEHARFIVLWGTNTMVTNLHLWPYVRRARAAGATVVAIDPVRTRTAERADWHVRPLPGSDAALALGMMHVIVAAGLHDEGYLESYCNGWPELRARLTEYPPTRVAALTGVPAAEIERLARAYATTRPAMIRTLVGPEKQPAGGTSFRTIACLPAVVGAWRELGGGLLHWTADLFARSLTRLGRARADVRVVNMVQLGRALTDASLRPPIRAMFVHDCNPASIAPNSNLVRRGLARNELFTVVHELFLTDTARYADLLLPATSFIEHLDLLGSWGHTYLTLNRPAIAPPGEAVSNTELFRRLAAAMGWADDPSLVESDEDLVRHALGSGHPYLAGITYERLQADGWAPLRLPAERRTPFAAGGFPTPSGRCELFAPPEPRHLAPSGGDGGFPLVMISAKTALHFLNTSYAHLPRHLRAQGAPEVQIDPVDAGVRGIADGDRVRLWNERGELVVTARVGDGVRPGVVAVPNGWWRSVAGGAPNDLTSDGLADIGGGGDFFGTRVELARA